MLPALAGSVKGLGKISHSPSSSSRSPRMEKEVQEHHSHHPATHCRRQRLGEGDDLTRVTHGSQYGKALPLRGALSLPQRLQYPRLMRVMAVLTLARARPLRLQPLPLPLVQAWTAGPDTSALGHQPHKGPLTPAPHSADWDLGVLGRF